MVYKPILQAVLEMRNQSVRVSKAKQYARRTAPSTGGIKHPYYYLYSWGDSAERQFHVHVCFENGLDENDLESLRQGKRVDNKQSALVARSLKNIKTWSKEEYDEAINDGKYLDLKTDLYDDLIFTPVRSFLHIDLLKCNNHLNFKKHPWARFITWFCGHIPCPAKVISAVFSPMQCIHDTAGQSLPFFIQFVYTLQYKYAGFVPYVLLTDKRTGASTRFFIYGGPKEIPVNPPPPPIVEDEEHDISHQQPAFDPELELERLQEAVTTLAKKMVNTPTERESFYEHVKKSRIQDYAQYHSMGSGLLCTPVCSMHKLEIMEKRNMLAKHPWGRFIRYCLFSPNFQRDNASVFSPLQYINMKHCTIQFIYDFPDVNELHQQPYIMLTNKNDGQVMYYFLYGCNNNTALPDIEKRWCTYQYSKLCKAFLRYQNMEEEPMNASTAGSSKKSEQQQRTIVDDMAQRLAGGGYYDDDGSMMAAAHHRSSSSSSSNSNSRSQRLQLLYAAKAAAELSRRSSSSSNSSSRSQSKQQCEKSSSDENDDMNMRRVVSGRGYEWMRANDSSDHGESSSSRGSRSRDLQLQHSTVAVARDSSISSSSSEHIDSDED